MEERKNGEKGQTHLTKGKRPAIKGQPLLRVIGKKTRRAKWGQLEEGIFAGGGQCN